MNTTIMPSTAGLAMEALDPADTLKLFCIQSVVTADNFTWYVIAVDEATAMAKLPLAVAASAKTLPDNLVVQQLASGDPADQYWPRLVT